ncbi:MAG: PAS domain S-box protein [Bacteroidales bacterium]|nr:PAS domain S-box protein [Bacteroidales bacterium]
MKSISNNKFRYRMIMLASGAAIMVLIAAIFHFRHQKQFIRVESHNQLQAISELKINQLTQWYKERLSEAWFFSSNVPYNLYIEDIIHTNKDSESDFREALLHIMSGQRYENILLLSADGTLIFSTVEDEHYAVGGATQIHTDKARQTRGIVVTDFYFCKEHQQVHIDFVAPAFDKKNNLIAFLVFRVNPNEYLFPLIRNWPLPSESAETYIVRKDGDSVTFLSRLRHIQMDPLKMKLSLNMPTVTAVRAIKGDDGIMEGIDYRGEPVLADIRKVPDTPWFMISEIDQREIYSALYKHAIDLAIIILISISMIGFITAWIYHYRQRNIYKELYTKQALLNFREEELRSTLYSIGEGVITTDNNGCIENLNPAAAIMTGWSENAARFKKVEEVVKIIHEDRRELLENPVDQVLRERRVVELTDNAVLINWENKEIPVAYNAAPIKDQKGKVLGVVLVISNQTEQRMRQKALEESEEKYRRIAENITDIVWTSDLSFRTTYVSPSVERLLGESPEEHMKRSMEDKFPPESLRKIEKAFSEEMEKEKDPASRPDRARMLEVEHYRADGSLIWVGMNVSYTRDSKGNITGFLGVTRDISEWRQAEEALRISEEKMRTLYTVAPTGIGMLMDGKLVEVNPLVCEISGYAVEELLGEPMSKLCPGNDECALAEIEKDNQVLLTGKGERDVRWKKKDGTFIDVSLSWLPIDPEHSSAGVIFTVRDVSEQKSIEEKLRTSDLIFNHSMDMLTISGFDGYFKVLNPAWERTLGWTQEELKAVPFMEFLHPDDVSITVQTHQELLNEKDVFQFENRYRCKDGTYKWLAWNSFCLRNEEIVFSVTRDITEKKLTEQELRSSFDLIKMAGESARFGGWQVDLAANRVIWSDVVAEIHEEKPGFSPTPEEGINYYAPEWRNRILEVYNRCLTDGVSFDEEMEIITSQGARKWVRAIGKPIYDSSCIITGLNGSFQDIQKIKSAEVKAEESQLVLSRLIGNLSGIAYRCQYTPEWTMEYISQGCMSITGYSDQDFYLKKITWGDIMLEQDRERVWLEVSDKLLKQVPFEIEYRIRHRNGSIRWLWDKECGVYGKNGEVIALEGFITDVTERRETEDALNEIMKNYRELIDGMNETIWVIDFDGTLLDVNRTAINILGYPKEELLKIGLTGIDNSLTREAIAALAGSMPEAELQIFETSHRTKDGRVFPVEIYSSLVTYQGRKAILSIARDITQRKQIIQDLIYAKEKAEESDRLKTAFLANVSHEIRTPMNGILGFLELLKKPNLTEEKKDKFIEVVNQSGERLLETINKIVEVSKIESGQVDISFVEVDVAEIMTYHYDFFLEQAAGKGLDFILNMDAVSDLKIMADRFKLDGVFTNLINNAIKFTPKGYIEFGAYQDKGDLVFYVKDTGLGIPENKQDAIFERFVQADLSLTRPYEGSGLGLSIVKAYAELIGGSVRVESKPGEGSTFYVTIPLMVSKEPDLEAAIQNLPEIAVNNRVKILIAEDDEVSISYLKTILEGDWNELIACTNGISTVETVRSQPDISIVLMDIRMPDMSGIEATKEIRKFNRTIPIIAQTANALLNDKNEAIQAGCNEYLTKPLNRVKLLELISKYTMQNKK